MLQTVRAYNYYLNLQAIAAPAILTLDQYSKAVSNLFTAIAFKQQNIAVAKVMDAKI